MFGFHRLGNILLLLRMSCPAYMMAVFKFAKPLSILFQIAGCRNMIGNLVRYSGSLGMRDSSATTQKGSYRTLRMPWTHSRGFLSFLSIGSIGIHLGLPSIIFDAALLWVPAGGRQQLTGNRPFPSYSWAGWIGPVEYWQLPDSLSPECFNNRHNAWYTMNTTNLKSAVTCFHFLSQPLERDIDGNLSNTEGSNSDHGGILNLEKCQLEERDRHKIYSWIWRLCNQHYWISSRPGPHFATIRHSEKSSCG